MKCDELVKRLRCKARLVREYNDTGMLEDEAADAIEELEKSINTIEQNYNVLLKINEKQGKDISFLTTILPKWIPVSERLPEVGEFVLVASATNPDIRIDLNRIGRDGYWFYMAYGITHWMPLPEPPKDGE